MKSPEKIPPVQTGNNLSKMPNAPTLEITEAALAGMEMESGGPRLSPPEKAEGIQAIGAAVWQTDKRVNGLYTTFNSRNSWMNIVGIGWKKLNDTNDSSNETMTAFAAHCREKVCRIDYSEENGIVKEIYVW